MEVAEVVSTVACSASGLINTHTCSTTYNEAHSSDGLPTSDGLQPTSDGLQPTSDGRQPTSGQPTIAVASNLLAMASNL